MPVDVSQVSALAADFRGVARGTPAAVGRTVTSTVRRTAAAARGNAPVRSGGLRGSVRFNARGLSGFVEATAGHAVFVEYGTAFMDPQPFMGPAGDARERGFYDDGEAAIAAVAQRAIG